MLLNVTLCERERGSWSLKQPAYGMAYAVLTTAVDLEVWAGVGTDGVDEIDEVDEGLAMAA